MQGPYDQFLLFGDSITQQSCSQADGFAFSPALQDGMTRPFRFPHKIPPIRVLHLCLCLPTHSDHQSPRLAFIRRLDVINRGFSVRHLPQRGYSSQAEHLGVQYCECRPSITWLHAKARTSPSSFHGTTSTSSYISTSSHCRHLDRLLRRQ